MSLRIKDVIKSKNTSVQEVADKMKISRVGLSQHINGNPSVEVLERIAKALNVPIKDLFDDEKEGEELTALIDYKGELYKAKNIDELKEITKKIESSLSN